MIEEDQIQFTAGRERAPHQASVLVIIAIAGIAVFVSLAHWLDSRRPPVDVNIEEERLYLTGNTAKRLSLGFNGLIADWYWMRSLQYVGRKIMNLPQDVELDSLGQLNLVLLAPLLDTATTVDPQFLEPYEYAAVVLPSVNVDEAIRITKRGIEANPGAWRLYQHLGYIYWQQGDFQSASKIYGDGAKLPGAPPWMEAMSARMAAEGGSRRVAREIYTRMYEQAGDKSVKEMARRRLMQLDSWDERDTLRKVIQLYRAHAGHCPASWREAATAIRTLNWRVDASGAPVDPSGSPYRLTKNGCDVDLDSASLVPAK